MLDSTGEVVNAGTAFHLSQGHASNAIVEAALAVFAAKGFDGAGIRQIAQAAGVPQPLLNHHFGGKEAL